MTVDLKKLSLKIYCWSKPDRTFIDWASVFLRLTELKLKTCLSIGLSFLRELATSQAPGDGPTS